MYFHSMKINVQSTVDGGAAPFINAGFGDSVTATLRKATVLGIKFILHCISQNNTFFRKYVETNMLMT